MIMQQNKFERKLPEDRRKALIDATLKCLSREGQDGLSVRKISKEAGISISLINYHYASKEDLVAQAYETLSSVLLNSLKVAVAQARGGPRDQLSALITAIFAEPTLDPGTLKCWLVFWGMIDNSRALRDVHDRNYSEYRRFVESILGRLADEQRMALLDIRLATIGLLAIVDGLWIEWCVNPDSFTVQEATRLCEAWIDALVIGGNRRQKR